MKKFVTPKIEIEQFDVSDVIATSEVVSGCTEETELS